MPRKAKPAPKPMKLNENLLAQWVTLDEQRKDLERQARQLDAAQKLIGTDIAAQLEASGKDEMKRGDYRCCFTERPGNPKWKEEFIRVAGAEQAVAVQAAVEPVKKLSVQRIGD